MAGKTSTRPDSPKWRQGYDAVESVVSPTLEQVVRSDQFAQGMALLAQLSKEVEQRAVRASRHLLHRLNLPAATDVTRLLTEIGELKKQVRQLSERLDDGAHLAPATPAKRKATTRGRARA